MRQHYTLGTILREKYVYKEGFLRDTYNYTEMFVFSTDVNRTLDSALS